MIELDYEEILNDWIVGKPKDQSLWISKTNDPQDEKKKIFEARITRQTANNDVSFCGAQSAKNVLVPIQQCLLTYRPPLFNSAQIPIYQSDLWLHLQHLLDYCSLIKISKLDTFYVELLPTPSTQRPRAYQGKTIREAVMEALKAQITA